jgi:hypothetical protein
MRLPLIAETELSSEQRPLYADMRAGIEKSFEGFTSISLSHRAEPPNRAACPSPLKLITKCVAQLRPGQTIMR